MCCVSATADIAVTEASGLKTNSRDSHWYGLMPSERLRPAREVGYALSGNGGNEPQGSVQVVSLVFGAGAVEVGQNKGEVVPMASRHANLGQGENVGV